VVANIASIWARVPHRPKSSPPYEGALNKKRILVVDDDRDVTDVLVRILETTGSYDVIAVNDSTKAVEAARGLHPDLVVLDIIMPTLDGGEVLAERRGDREFSNLREIFLTGLVSSEEIGSEGYEISGHPVIPKPLSTKTFRAVVAGQLDTEV
jgi:CheY-like chemotaxis protein